MARGEGGGGHYAERQREKASRKPIKKVSVDAGSDAIVRAIVKPRAKPVAKKRKVVPLPRAKPSKIMEGLKGDLQRAGPMLMARRTPPHIPGSAAGLPRMDFRQLPGSAAGLQPRRVQSDSDPGTVYPVSTGNRGGREDYAGGDATFGNWDIAQQAQGQDLLQRIQKYTTQRNLDRGNLNTQRIKRRGIQLSTIE